MVIMKRKLSELKVAELRVELIKRGLDSRGLKGVLIERLKESLAIEGDGEVEMSGPDVASPKSSGRRSTSRSKRAQEIENQEEPIESTPPPQTVDHSAIVERGDKMDEESETNGEDLSESPAQMPVDDEAEPESGEDSRPEEHDDEHGDGTPTRDEEGDVEAPQYDEEDDGEPPEGEEIAEETYVSEDAQMYEGEEPGNDYREDNDEEDAEYQVEEEEEEVNDEPGGDEEMVTVEEAVAENEESDAGRDAEDGVGDEMVEEVEEEEQQQELEPEKLEHERERGQEIPMDNSEKYDTENLDATDETDSSAKTADEKSQSKTESSGKDDVVSAEVDFLDMLDYDLDIGDQNNINTPSSEDQAGKGEHGKRDSSKSRDAANSKDAQSSKSSSDDRKSRPSLDSSKAPTSDQSKSGTTSSKSGSSSAAKDGSKTSSSGKRDGSASSSKKDDGVNKNLWISGLSSSTRASELKSAFSRYGKVIGAKVVTNVKSPGSRCYGYVTMATADAASKCILHLNNTEMHSRMITVEIAKGDPSASSKKQSSTSGSSLSKKDSESKDAKSKDGETKSGSTSSRRPSSTVQSAGKDGESTDKDKSESDKKSQDSKQRESGQSARRNTDDSRKGGTGKSPAHDRSRADRNSTSGPRTGDKRPNNRSPPHNRGAPGRSEPERKRPRPPDAGDRKVVMDSNKGELRVNFSRNAGAGGRNPRWQGEPKPRPLPARRRSGSPARRRSLSPLRGPGPTRPGGMRGGRGGRGGLITRQSATYEDRNMSRIGARSQRTGQILTIKELRAQQRARGSDRGRGGLSRGDMSANRERLRREREERDRLRIERERLERERRQLEKDRQERERLEAERLRLEQERKRELERIEREKAEMRRLQEITRYEVEQRQRAIKRTYDDDSNSHRGGGRAPNRDGYDSKRQMVAERERNDTRRGERDDRRGSYENYGSRSGPPRNGPSSSEPPPPGTTDFRSRQQGSFRSPTGVAPGKGGSASYHDNRRGPQDSHRQSDARYAGGSTGGRAVEKYDRRSNETSGRSVEYSSHGYDRSGSAAQAPRRGAAPPAQRDNRDGRKVVRERSNEGRGVTTPEYRRTGGRTSAGGRVEIIREQSPSARRARRDAGSPPTSSSRAPPSGSRGGSWRDSGKGGRDSSRRGADDRDLREQIRGRQDSYSESSRDRSGQRRGRSSHSQSPPPRSSGQYSSRWPEGSSGDSSSQQIYAIGNDGNAIPTTGRSSGSTAWGHVQQWQQGATQSTRGWPGTAIPAATSSVNRQVIAPYGTVPSPTALIAPPTAMIPGTQGYISSSDRQSRSFQASYSKPAIQRRL